MSKRFPFVIAVLGIFLLSVAFAGTASAKPKKPIVYPVKVTIKIIPAELPPDSPWHGVEGIAGYPVIALAGKVISPNPACKRKRPIYSVSQPSWAPEAMVDKSTGVVTDAAGNWEGEAVPDTNFSESIRTGKERLWVKVPRKQIGKGRSCAEATSARLKA